MKVLQIISAHAEAQEVFDRHVPIWKNNDSENMVYCPSNSVVKTDLPLLSWGDKGHHGEASLKRYLQLFRWMDNWDYDLFAIQEYDSFCLSKELPMPTLGSIGANVFFNNNPESEFKGSKYLHYPLVIPKSIIRLLVCTIRANDHMAEHGFFDRWLGYWCDRERQTICDWSQGGHGWSENTITDASKIPKHTTLIHGVKTKEVLDKILSTRSFT